jgi:hypothetical protein
MLSQNAVRIGLPRRDEVSGNLISLQLGQHRVAIWFLCPRGSGQAYRGARSRLPARAPPTARDRGVGDRRQAYPGHVIDESGSGSGGRRRSGHGLKAAANGHSAGPQPGFGALVATARRRARRLRTLKGIFHITVDGAD